MTKSFHTMQQIKLEFNTATYIYRGGNQNYFCLPRKLKTNAKPKKNIENPI